MPTGYNAKIAYNTPTRPGSQRVYDILTYCVLFWLLSWNFIGLLDASCKDAPCIDAPCMIVAVDTQVGVAWLIDFYKPVW